MSHGSESPLDRLSASQGETVGERLERQFRDLTRAERQLAATLLENYPVSGIGSITALARDAGVSTPTVGRLVQKLGYPGFAAFQEALRAELSEILRKPADKLGRDASTGGAPLERHFSAVVANLAQTRDRIDPQALDAVAELLADLRRSIRTAGGRFTRILADHMARHFSVARPGVAHLGADIELWPQGLLDLAEGDVLVVFDIRRYEPALERLAAAAHAAGVEVILITDQWGSPISRLARHRLHARIEAPSAWDSLVALLALVEALVAEAQARNPDLARRRMERLEALMAEVRVFGRPR